MLIKRKHGWEVPEKEMPPSRDNGPRRPPGRPRADLGGSAIRREGSAGLTAQNSLSPSSWPVSPIAQTRHAQLDLSRRRYMLQVYAYMACGLALAGIVAHLMTHSDFHASIAETSFVTPFVWPLLLAPLGLIMLLSLGVEEMSFFAAEVTFWAYAALTGFALGCIVMIYTGANIAPLFLVAGATFASMSLYGYVTQTNLSKLGLFLVMGVVGIVLNGIVNLALAPTVLEFALSLIGVILFVALTASDTRRLEEIYLGSDAGELISRKALMGALALYLDATIFPLFLQLQSGRRG
jgi:hypothetical protein